MTRLGIEFITALGQDPVAFVHLAADLGVPRIGLALAPIVLVPDDAPRWSLRDDAGLRSAVETALAEREVELMLGEGFLIHPQTDVADAAADMDLLGELGAKRVNVVTLEEDRARGEAQFATFAAMATARGMRPTLEFIPGTGAPDLAAALRLVEASHCPTAGVLIDAMHHFRSGGTAAQIAALDPARIGHVQLCDVPLVSRAASYMEEAKFERGAPGEGELPLAAMIAALPAGIPLGLECPQRARALGGEDHAARLNRIIAAAQRIST